MTAPRLMIHVQHLLGVGHLMRATALARAAAAAGFEVDVVSGGMPVAGLDLGGATLHQLPPLRSQDRAFEVLVDEAGQPIDAGWRTRRRDRLLALYADRRPDVLVIEMFPFGRRAMRFELLPLLDHAIATESRPLIVCSVRDIVQAGRKPGRAEETVALVERAFDLVLVHGDPALVRLDDSFPLAARLGSRLRYTGYVAPPAVPRGGPGDPGWGEVVVSAGGGAVGQGLLAAVLGARPLTRLRDKPWRLLVGGNVEEPELAALAARAPSGVVVERARPDFPRLLANCRISVSQAGYNTAMDVINAAVRAVLVPFVGRDETEQTLRAERLAERGLAVVVPEAALSAERLAEAIDAADRMPPPSPGGIDRDGAVASVRLIRATCAARRAVRQ